MASETLQAPKGTRDFYPEEMRAQNHLFEGWRKVCRAFGYEEYEGPTFEHLDLFRKKSGQEIENQLYTFKDKGDRELALRPEMTPTLARMVNQKGNSLKLPLRWFSIPRLFRYERTQKGRLREFFQLNMDIVGCNTVAAEADLLAAIIEMMKGFGLGPQDFSVRVSSRLLLSEFLDKQGVAKEKKAAVYSALDKRAKIGEVEFRGLLETEGLTATGIEAVEGFFNCQSLAEFSARFPAFSGKPSGFGGRTGLGDLQTLFASLESQGYGEFVALDFSVVRGLAYYTGIVFEVYDKARSLRAIAGGGRYDDLLASLGGQPLSGVGFGMGDVVLMELLREKGLLPSGPGALDYFLVDVTPVESGLPRAELLALAKHLRTKGRCVAYALSGERLKKQMAQADELGARRALFFGSDRAEAGKYEVKDLATGEQKVLGEIEL